MELAELEPGSVQKNLIQPAQTDLVELSDLQMAIVGGGSGDVVFA
jgi:hypothetical protein